MIDPKKKLQRTAVIAALLLLTLALTTCSGGGGGGDDEEDSEYYIWFYDFEGGGEPPESKWVKSGETITLPGQGDMIAPSGKDFKGWVDTSSNTGGNNNNTGGAIGPIGPNGPNDQRIYAAGESIEVYKDYNFRAEWSAKKYSQGGVYISLMSFAGNAEFLRYNNNWQDNGDDFILLNSNGKQNLEYILDYQYRMSTTSGTALFYAVHKALANLTANASEFPTDISSVNIITFTDGLDNASFGASNNAPIEGKSGVTSGNYATYINGEIGSRTINGLPVTAYSVGIKGSDVTDDAQFTANLSNIASTPGNVKQPTDFGELEEVFSEIAESLRFATTFSMTTTQNDPDTVVRMTFDVTGTSPADAEASSKYIEGTLAYSSGDRVWTLTNIAYEGITSATPSGGSITGTVSGNNVSFLFKNISGHDDPGATIQQWTKASAEATAWQRNSEYIASDSASASAIIQLVLDASTSLNDQQVGQIREAVKSFIGTLYTRIQN
jgi:hypothetical protein